MIWNSLNLLTICFKFIIYSLVLSPRTKYTCSSKNTGSRNGVILANIIYNMILLQCVVNANCNHKLNWLLSSTMVSSKKSAQVPTIYQGKYLQDITSQSDFFCTKGHEKTEFIRQFKLSKPLKCQINQPYKYQNLFFYLK